MDNLQWYDFVRLGTSVLAIVSMWRLGHLMVRNHQTYSPRLKDFIFVLNIAFFTQMIGSLESVIRDAPWRYTIVLSLALTVVGVRATRQTDKPLIT